MAIGLSTYSFFWQHSDRVEKPLGIAEMVEETARLGVGIFQICDYPAVEQLTASELVALRDLAEGLGVALELGTRGTRPEHLARYLALASALGVSLVRTMLLAGDGEEPATVTDLRRLISQLDDRGVTLALETYEQVPTETLVRAVAALDSKRVGVCLDVANVIARYETQRDVIDRVADRVVNLHVKDFRFERAEGLVGFSLTGAELGTGDLDADYLFDRVRPYERGINQIVEHWLPWQADEASTVSKEQAWTRSAIDFLRRREQAYKSTG